MGQYKNTLGQAIYDDLENNTYLKKSMRIFYITMGRECLAIKVMTI